MGEITKVTLLEQDLIENRQVKFYSDGFRVIQENNTNPRIRRLSSKIANEFITITETLPEYSVRIVKHSGLPLMLITSKYEIEWVPGVKTGYKSIDIRNSSEEGVFLTIYLVKI